MGNRARAVTAGAVLIFSLGGCSAVTTPKSAVTHTPSSSASAEPAPSKPAFSDLTLTADGIVYIRVGEKVPARSNTEAIVAYDPVACVNGNPDGVKAGEPGAGAWQSTYPGGYFENFDIATADPAATGIVKSINVFTAAIQTDRGIHSGSTLAQVQRAYPEFDETLDAVSSEVYVTDGASGRLLIEVANEDPSEPDYWTDGEVGHVLWIRAIGLDQPTYAIAGTDSSGPCPP